MGATTQEIKGSFDMSRAMRQFNKADKSFANNNVDAAVKHLQKGYNQLDNALTHIVAAAEDTYEAAGAKIEKGNADLQKSIDEYANGNDNSASRHYADAMNYYDEALDMVDEY